MQAFNKSTTETKEEDFNLARDTISSGKLDSDFAAHEQWALPSIMVFAQKITEGQSSMMDKLEKRKEQEKRQEEIDFSQASRFFGLSPSKPETPAKEKGKGKKLTPVTFSKDDEALLSRSLLTNFDSLPEVHTLFVHSISKLTSIPFGSLTYKDLCVLVVCEDLVDAAIGVRRMERHGFLLFDSVVICIPVPKRKDTKGKAERTLKNNKVFVCAFLPKGNSRNFRVTPPVTIKKSDLSVWKGSLAPKKGGLFLKYPKEKKVGVMFDGAMYVRLLSTFAPLAPQPKVHPPCVLEVPEAGCTIFLACVKLGLGYVGYQTSSKVSEYILRYGAQHIRQEVGEDAWAHWTEVQMSLLPPPPPFSPSPSSSSGKRKRRRISDSPSSAAARKYVDISASCSSGSSDESSEEEEGEEEEDEDESVESGSEQL